MSVVASAANIKAYLGTIKETIIDTNDGKTIYDLDVYFKTLLCLEILQRGVIVTNSNNNNNNNNNIQQQKLQQQKLQQQQQQLDGQQLLQTISSVAGKTLLSVTTTTADTTTTTSTIPKQLIAGCAVIAGRIAELTSQKVLSLLSTSNTTTTTNNTNTNTNNTNPLSTLFSSTDISKTLDRCKAVDEIRLASILKLVTLGIYDVSDIKLPSSTTGTTNQSNTIGIVICYRLLIIAEGYYYRAATLQNDLPQMWKKIWECIEERQNIISIDTTSSSTHSTHSTSNQTTIVTSTSWMSSIPITNLIRIAQNKNNSKRCIELLLKLIESYVDNIPDPYSIHQQQENTNGLLLVSDIVVFQTFINEYRPIIPYNYNDTTTMVQTALKHLETILQSSIGTSTTTSPTPTTTPTSDPPLLSDTDQLVYQLLKVRVGMLIEESTIRTNSTFEYQKIQNRAADTSTTGSSKTVNTSTNKTNTKQHGSKIVVPPVSKVKQQPIIKTKSMEECYQECRTNYFISSNIDDDDSKLLVESVVQLRDTVIEYICSRNRNSSISSPGQEQQIEQYYYYQGCILMTIYVSRLKDQAQAIATSKTKQNAKLLLSDHHHYEIWTFLSNFIIPVVDSVRTKCLYENDTTSTNNTSNSNSILLSYINSFYEYEINFIEKCCIELVSVEWMYCSNSNRYRLLNPIVLQFLSDIVPIFLQRRQQQEMNINQNNSKQNFIVSSTTSHSDHIVITSKRLSAALYSIQAWKALQNNVTIIDTSTNEYTTTMIRLISNNATQRSIDYCDSLSAEFGYGYLEFLLCWSGLISIPWTYCTLPEARIIAIRARQCLNNSYKIWGRQIDIVTGESQCITLSEGDIEGAYFDGGLSSIGISKYLVTIQFAQTLVNDNNNTILRDIYIARCCTGLNKIKIKNLSAATNNKIPNKYDAQMALNILQKINVDDNNHLLLWTSSHFIKRVIQSQLASVRQLVAEAMFRNGKTTEALQYLQEAFQDAPDDATIAFSLGLMQLYLSFFSIASTDAKIAADRKRTAQVQLMKAAKLDSTLSSPFALLGYSYEAMNDKKRAIGCYTKALSLDPTHPVAGRGLLRLESSVTVRPILERSIDIVSASNGWAWRAIGLHKCTIDGDDETGLIALQKALRCKDITEQQQHSFDSMSSFFSSPIDPQLPSRQEVISVLTDIASCYRRLGRFTAAIRSYHTALEESVDNPASFLLCQCAQVELELGLYEEAQKKFNLAIQLNDERFLAIAIVGRGLALMALSKRDLEDSKLGSSFRYILQAIEQCELIQKFLDSSSVQKLLGDLCTLAGYLPSDLFTSGQNTVEIHCKFIGKGEVAYYKAEKCIYHSSEDSVGIKELKASLITDAGTNVLLRAQLVSRHDSKGIDGQRSPEAEKLFNNAENAFRRAIDICPTFALAWCGLGCSVIASDTLLAQHAFCRSVELDRYHPDSYSNLCFLYTAHKSLSASEELCETLTEIADTPMMWLNRALITEDSPTSNQDLKEIIRCKQQAADAYRASLQVSRHPVGILGLAMTCRTKKDERSSESECLFLLSEFLNLFDQSDPLSSTFEAVMEAQVATNFTINRSFVSSDIVSKGREKVLSSLHRLSLPPMPVDASGNKLDGEPIANLVHLIEEYVETPSPILDKSIPNPGSSILQLSRRIINEPNNGVLWVKLAKGCVKESFNKSSNEKMSPAFVSANRAVSILTNQLTTTTSSSRNLGSDNSIKSIDLADAFAVRFWVTAMTKSQRQIAPTPLVSTLDLQRALMLDPTNRLARNALQIQTS